MEIKKPTEIFIQWVFEFRFNRLWGRFNESELYTPLSN